jgi:succinate dehydrogenase assembly factor 1
MPPPAASAASTASRAFRHSGLQKQVLSLYRTTLRTARERLPAGESRAQAEAFARTEFRSKARSVDKLDIQRIEFLIRQGKKKLDLVGMEGVSGFAAALPSSKDLR